MKEGAHVTGASGRSGKGGASNDGPAIQVICLGCGGGPCEDDVTGFLVRSTASNWSKGSVLAVDAGSHLAAIRRILEKDFPLVSNPKVRAKPTSRGQNPRNSNSQTPSEEDLSDISSSASSESPPPSPPVTVLPSGPFAGLPFPHASARANAVHVVREHIATYLITHPHLDHLSGFAINTPAFHNTSRPKRLAALPGTVTAIKNHVFNDVIWPNLTDEDNGVGFVTFQRLTEGGNLALGEGPSQGFIEVCDGLAVKGFKVSHGAHASSPPTAPPMPHHHAAVVAAEHARRASIPGLNETPGAHNGATTRGINMSISAPDLSARRASILSLPSQPGTPTASQQPPTGGERGVGADPHAHSGAAAPTQQQQREQHARVVDSSAFFIRAEPSGREILIFGDVEPDSVSLLPRTHVVWAEAAGKIAAGILRAVFIECSYTDAQPDEVLFGHLAPRHLIQELAVLAEMVAERKREMAAAAAATSTPNTPGLGPESKDGKREARKRKRVSVGGVREIPPSPERAQPSHSHSSKRPDAGPLVLPPASSPTSPDAVRKRSRSRAKDLVGASASASTMPDGDDLMDLSPTLPPPETSGSAVPQPTDPYALPRSRGPTPVPDTPTPHASGPAPTSAAGAPLAAAQMPHHGIMVTGWGGKGGAAEDYGPANALRGLKVCVMHVKDSLADGPLVGELILEELGEHERRLGAVGMGLGCEFEVCGNGDVFLF